MRFLALFLFLTLCMQNADATETLSLAKVIKRPSLDWPVDCEFGKDCWIYNYVDMIPDDGIATDRFCGARSYDGHKGTDIGVLTVQEMERGVDVIAPADGVVKKTRDGDNDSLKSEEEIEEIKAQRKECGNAILIDHGDGLETIYCHLKKNSITVKPNTKVKAGDKIAQIGLSGMTEFPHLHFGVLVNGEIIDPFTYKTNTQECGASTKGIWSKDIQDSNQRLILNSGGFTDQVIGIKDVYDEGSVKNTLPQSSNILLFWFSYLGAIKGDSIKIEILDPNLKSFASQEIIQDKTRAQQFYYTGKKISADPLQAGVYIGKVTITRQNNKGQEENWSFENTVTVLPH